MNALSNQMNEEFQREILAVESSAHADETVSSFKRWALSLPLEKKVRMNFLVNTSGSMLALLAGLLALFDVIAPTTAVGIMVPFVAVSLFMTANGIRFFIHNVIRPVVGVTQEMTRLAGGARDIVVTHTERGDEIGDLARSLDVFTKSGRKLDELFDDRQATEARRQQELATLASSFESSIGDIVSGVAAASTQLNATAGSMANAAEQAAGQAGQVTGAMEQASGGVTAAAAASDEFAMSIGEISRQASNSAELARKASDDAESADETISALTASADQVSQIVELIQSIAQRTNLLALNASIEAARGGEAGRGFAVVASEVKALSGQTTEATKEIKDVVANLHTSIDVIARMVG